MSVDEKYNINGQIRVLDTLIPDEYEYLTKGKKVPLINCAIEIDYDPFNFSYDFSIYRFNKYYWADIEKKEELTLESLVDDGLCEQEHFGRILKVKEYLENTNLSFKSTTNHLKDLDIFNEENLPKDYTKAKEMGDEFLNYYLEFVKETDEYYCYRDPRMSDLAIQLDDLVKSLKVTSSDNNNLLENPDLDESNNLDEDLECFLENIEPCDASTKSNSEDITDENSNTKDNFVDENSKEPETNEDVESFTVGDAINAFNKVGDETLPKSHHHQCKIFDDQMRFEIFRLAYDYKKYCAEIEKYL